MPANKRKKILVINPFSIYPPMSGGQGRVFYLFKNMAATFDVFIICLSHLRSYKEISKGLIQLTVPKSPLHCKLEQAFAKEVGFYTCAMTEHLIQHTPEFKHFLDKYITAADFIILSHPYLIHEVKKCPTKAIIIYDAHNVEYDLHRFILADKANKLLEAIYQTELAACRKAKLVTTCSQFDADRLIGLYNISSAKVKIVPNGASLNSLPFVKHPDRMHRKEIQKITRSLAFFMGSDFLPNIQAVHSIITCASKMPEIDFLIAGSVCNQFKGANYPVNVKLLGLISEEEKLDILGQADIALNPIPAGSGTSLKLLEYMASGIPVVSTITGARGINGVNGKHYLLCECNSMPDSIRLIINNPVLAASIAADAYSLVKVQYDWQQIAGVLTAYLKRMVN